MILISTFFDRKCKRKSTTDRTAVLEYTVRIMTGSCLDCPRFCHLRNVYSVNRTTLFSAPRRRAKVLP